jgi:putative oxidoreductase
MDAALALGRVVLVTMFIFSGLGKLFDLSGTIAYIGSKGLPFVELLAVGAGLGESIGGLAIVFGWRTRLAAVGLIAFTAATTLLFHDFWNVTGDDRISEMTHAWKNLTIIGGLIVLAAAGPGRWSVDGGARRLAPRDYSSSRGSRASLSTFG